MNNAHSRLEGRPSLSKKKKTKRERKGERKALV